MRRLLQTSRDGSKKQLELEQPTRALVWTRLVSIYELGVLGAVSAPDVDRLTKTITRLVSDFGLGIGSDFVVRQGVNIEARDKRAAFAATYFGDTTQPDVNLARNLARASLPIIPTISSTGSFEDLVPDFLRSLNGLRRRTDDHDLLELATGLLECLGLLRPQRRVFVSYRRNEARAAAVQLHDLLCARGFDVFLDTHDIRPGEPFQEVLWHRLCDSDVVVMLDTPRYFESKWTRQEIGRARAKEIHVLRVIWPAHTPNKHTDFAESIYLNAADLIAADGPIRSETADQIALAVERLRSRSIAARHMSIAGRLRAEVERIGGTVEGIGAHRAISLRLADDQQIWAYPVVGVPTADLLNDVAKKARRADQDGTPFLVYDHIGIRDQWLEHLAWLDENISSVRALKVGEAGWVLAALDL